MLQRGKLVIVGMVSVAAVAAGFAWWHQYLRGARVLAIWGSVHAGRIRLADDCELWRLEPRSTDSPREVANGLAIGGRIWTISRRVRVSGAPGFIHARQALIQDASHDWSASQPDPSPRWTYALRFRDASGQTIVAFDEQAARACLAEEPQTISRLIDIGPGLVLFFENQLGDSGHPR
jgi:hypothetical protein